MQKLSSSRAPQRVFTLAPLAVAPPRGITPVKRLANDDAAAQEVKDVKVPPQVVRWPHLLLGSFSPEIAKSLPAVSPPSLSPRHGLCVLRDDAQAASTPALQRLETTTRSPPAASLPTNVNVSLLCDQHTPPSMVAILNINYQGSLSDNGSGKEDVTEITYSILTVNNGREQMLTYS